MADIALMLTFLWGRDKARTDAVKRDLEDCGHRRRLGRREPGPSRPANH